MINITISEDQLKVLKEQIIKEYQEQLNDDAIVQVLKKYHDYQVLNLFKEVIMDDDRRQKLEYINPKDLREEEKILLHMLLLLQEY